MPAVMLEKFPRTAVDVFIEVLQADGGTRCAASMLQLLLHSQMQEFQ